MASQQAIGETITEYCTDCDRGTSKDVWLEFQQESRNAQEKNTKFSRESYRVTKCTVCEATTSQRMHNA